MCTAPASPSRRRGRGARRERRGARKGACAGASAPRRILSLTERPESGCEVPEHGRLGDHLETADGARVGDDRRRRVARLLELPRAVDTPRNGKTNQLERGDTVLARGRVAAGHDRADLHTANAAREVERAGERLCGELGRGDVREYPARVQIDGVTADRLQDGGPLLLQDRTEVADLRDAVAKVVLVEDLPESGGYRL